MPGTKVWLAVFCAVLSAGTARGGETVADSGCPGVVQVGDISMGYRIFGEGYPLVLITGFSGTMDMWHPEVVSILSSRYRVVVFDNRGIGETSGGTADFTIEQFADDTAGLMDALGIERAHVLSWSMGTEIALELALRHPGMVDRLILYAGDCGMSLCPPSPEVLADLYDTSGTDEERGMRLLSHLFPGEWLSENADGIVTLFSGFTETASAASVQRQAEAMDAWPGALDRLGQITTPTLLVTGTEDVLTPPGNSIILRNGLPDARILEFENAGHGLMYQYPKEFAEAVLGFLSS